MRGREGELVHYGHSLALHSVACIMHGISYQATVTPTRPGASARSQAHRAIPPTSSPTRQVACGAPCRTCTFPGKTTDTVRSGCRDLVLIAIKYAEASSVYAVCTNNLLTQGLKRSNVRPHSGL